MHTSPIDLEVVRRDLHAAPHDTATHAAGRYRWESWLYGRSRPGPGDGPTEKPGPPRARARRVRGPAPAPEVRVD